MAALYTLWMGLALLGALGILQTPAEAQVSPQPDFQQDKFLGEWFTSGFASNSSWLRENEDQLYVSKSVVVPMENGGLNFTNIYIRWDSRAGFRGRERPSPRWWPRDTQDLILTQGSPAHSKDQCNTRSLLLQPEGTPGYYSYKSPGWGSTREVWMVDTDYEDYALLYTVGTRDLGQDAHVIFLYSMCPPSRGPRGAPVVGGAEQRPSLLLLPAPGRSQTPSDEVKEKFTTYAKAKGFTEDSIVFLPQMGERLLV
uniref:Prostaglandin-H2 D-isomerase n=1 Tax=Rhinolophus ferrumequinum TaxID=59479 RepID=A0A671E5F9_RHIFE